MTAPFPYGADLELPETLEYTGEFGPELILFMPFCAWLAKAGILRRHRIKTYLGMRCFYDDFGAAEVIEKPGARRYVEPAHRPSWLPVRDEFCFDGKGRSPFHFVPDLRARFANRPDRPGFVSSKPILVIHNKYNLEWSGGPVNYIPLNDLESVFRELSPDFTIIYIRHGIAAPQHGYSEDHNSFQPFGDRAVLDRHPEIICFDTLFNLYRHGGGAADINTFKNMLYSRCHHFITTQGGGAHQIALFSGAVMIILHSRGSEENWAYGDGYYGFMARIPPIRAICRDSGGLMEALPLLQNTQITGDRVQLDPANAHLLEKFSPWTIATRK